MIFTLTLIFGHLKMPFKPPPRDMSTVKCIKRSKDKNGEEQIEYMVQFDYVSINNRDTVCYLNGFGFKTF